MAESFDVIIVGSGLSGLTLALALAQPGLSLRVALVDGDEPQRLPDVAALAWPLTHPAAPAYDPRVYALSRVNRDALTAMGAWLDVASHRVGVVERMDIRGDERGRLLFYAYSAGETSLAMIVESQLLAVGMTQALAALTGVERLAGKPSALRVDASGVCLSLGERTLRAPLIVGADGRHSWLRQQTAIKASLYDYGQSGLVVHCRGEEAHHGTAFQWFGKADVLALLPLPGHDLSVVWSLPTASAQALVREKSEGLAEKIAAAADHRLGRLTLLSRPLAFPLALMQVPTPVAERAALIGDAAHLIHPLSGHGINLGMQDALTLAALVRRAAHDGADLGGVRTLIHYLRQRRQPVARMQQLTHALHRLFASPLTPVALARNLGMNCVDRLGFVKNNLIYQAVNW